MRNRFEELTPLWDYDLDNPNTDEIEHYQNCPICGESIDLRDFAEVTYHDESWDHERLHTLH